MKRKILIVSSDLTGHGHKSITMALKERFAVYPEVEITVIDGFALRGTMSLKIGKLYGPMTRNAKELWKLIWEISMRSPEILCEITEAAIKENFLKVLGQVQPDLILSVHPNFNGSILNILSENNIDIPFVTLIADLVSITPQWTDKRADYILCPTIESKEVALSYGIPEENLVVCGFPIRSKFCEGWDKQIDRTYDNDRVLNCLIMSGGEGSGNMSRIARKLLDNFNTRVTIVAGRNKSLKERLENTLGEKYGNRVKVHGFVENIQDLMLASDVAFTRGSPNTMLEVVYCNVPLVVTGALPGQEEGNPGYLEKYGLGVVCREVKNIKYMMEDLLANNGEKLLQIKENQRLYRDSEIPKNIVEFLLAIPPRKGYIPQNKKKFSLRKIKADKNI